MLPRPSYDGIHCALMPRGEVAAVEFPPSLSALPVATGPAAHPIPAVLGFLLLLPKGPGPTRPRLSPSPHLNAHEMPRPLPSPVPEALSPRPLVALKAGGNGLFVGLLSNPHVHCHHSVAFGFFRFVPPPIGRGVCK